MAENGADEAQAPQIRMNVLTQYIRDLSFENILSQKGTNGEVTPDVQVQVNLDARKRAADHQFAQPGSRVRSGLLRPHGARHEDRCGDEKQLWVWWY